MGQTKRGLSHEKGKPPNGRFRRAFSFPKGRRCRFRQCPLAVCREGKFPFRHGGSEMVIFLAVQQVIIKQLSCAKRIFPEQRPTERIFDGIPCGITVEHGENRPNPADSLPHFATDLHTSCGCQNPTSTNSISCRLMAIFRLRSGFPSARRILHTSATSRLATTAGVKEGLPSCCSTPFPSTQRL